MDQFSGSTPPPSCKITVEDKLKEQFSKWCQLHHNEQTIFFCRLDEKNMVLSPQFNTYSFWPQGHDKGDWYQAGGAYANDHLGAVVGLARKGPNYMKKNYYLYAPTQQSKN